MRDGQEKTKILIVEDDKMLSDVYATTFQNNGFTVFTAYTGEDGLILLAKELPDVVLLDIMLSGGMGGLEVLKKIRETSATADIPVMISSNLGDDQTISEGMKLGANGYLIKTQFNPDDVVRNVRVLVK